MTSQFINEPSAVPDPCPGCPMEDATCRVDKSCPAYIRHQCCKLGRREMAMGIVSWLETRAMDDMARNVIDRITKRLKEDLEMEGYYIELPKPPEPYDTHFDEQMAKNKDQVQEDMARYSAMG